MGSSRRKISRALLSVYNKNGLIDLARVLNANGVEIVSTGSTAKRIAEAGIPVTPVEDVTGFPECLDGRVKTLHPKIHAGILANLSLENHVEQLQEMGIAPFDLVVVNLYPFTETVASGASTVECVEQIDIGGPTMVRAAAKNHGSVAVVVSPSQYTWLAERMELGGTTLEERQHLAAKAFSHTADYDVAVASWLGSVLAPGASEFPEWLGATWNLQASLRYGENPHQHAALYESAASGGGLAGAAQLHGKEMSYNNYVDADAAWRAVWDHTDPAIAIIKHTNPCGIASGSTLLAAYEAAHACDPLSAFGGIIASNRLFTADVAMACQDVFTEVIIAPEFEERALAILRAKPSVRILQAAPPRKAGVDLRPILGGALLQHSDHNQAEGDRSSNWKLVSGAPADESTLADLEFAWRCLRSVKSNAIALAHHRATVGIGMGQVNRVDSARLAIARAGDRAQGSVAASDAFFPFADGLEILLSGGVRAVVQPGGSMRDEEVIALAHSRGITMYFTGARHFTH